MATGSALWSFFIKQSYFFIVSNILFTRFFQVHYSACCKVHEIISKFHPHNYRYFVTWPLLSFSLLKDSVVFKNFQSQVLIFFSSTSNVYQKSVYNYDLMFECHFGTFILHKSCVLYFCSIFVLFFFIQVYLLLYIQGKP